MELRLYIKQADTFNKQMQQIYYAVPANKAMNPQNLVATLGGIPQGSRQWPSYGSFIDVTDSVSDLSKLKLTWTIDKTDTGVIQVGALQQKKSASGSLTFEGNAYTLLRQWLIDDISAPLNSVDVKIEHRGDDGKVCGTYEDYSIKASDLSWCDSNAVCNFDVVLKQKDETLNCIKSTLISDNWDGLFQPIPTNGRKHPRFSYCNEQRPNGMMVMLWWIASVSIVPTFLVFIPLLAVIDLIIKIINIIIGIFTYIWNAIGYLLGGSPPGQNTNWNVIPYFDLQAILDSMAQFYVESAGCGREHPAPLIRDYIKNVCDYCGVHVDEVTADIFFAKNITIQTSNSDRPGTIGGLLQTVANPHYNACYLFPQVQRGIRRFDSLNIFGAPKVAKDYYIVDNRPLLTLDMFLDELKKLYNAEWRIKNNTLYFWRKDRFMLKDSDYIYDFTNNSADRLKILEGICFEWNEIKTPSFARGLYTSDPADACGNEAMKYMNQYVSFGNVDDNPTFEGEMDKSAQYGATKFRLDGASMDYVYDAMQITVNGSFLTPFLAGFMFDFVASAIEEYGDYALLLQDETTSLPKVVIWDGQSYENARVVKGKQGVDLSAWPISNYTLPDVNPRFNANISQWYDLHPPDTKVRGENLTLPPFHDGYYTVTDFFGAREIKKPALLVNYPMYFEPDFYDTMWDWFHWIDDPRLNPILNQNWTVKIDLCCDDLKETDANGKPKLGVFNDAGNIALGEKVKLPLTYYQDGRITQIEVSYDTSDANGQYIELKGTV